MMKHGYVDRVTDSGDIWVRHGDEKKGRNAKQRRPGSFAARSPQVKAGGKDGAPTGTTGNAFKVQAP